MTPLRSFPVTIAVSILLLASACSGVATGTTGGGQSGVDGSKKLTDLSSAESAQFCDFEANQLGGYGYSASVECDGGTARKSAPKTQTSCVENLAIIPAGCPITVSQFESCLSVLAATSACDLRTSPPICAALAQPDCTLTTTTTVRDAGTPDATTGGSCGYRCVNDACTCDSGPASGNACQEKSSVDPAYCSTFCCH